MWILRLCKALEAAAVPYALVGGCAVALHGAVRGTVDVDLIVAWEKEVLQKLETALRSLGLQPRHPLTAEQIFKDRLALMAEKNLLAWSFSNPSNPTELVDVLLTHDLAGKQTILLPVAGAIITILAKADLIAMKREAGRPQDQEDVRALESLP